MGGPKLAQACVGISVALGELRFAGEPRARNAHQLACTTARDSGSLFGKKGEAVDPDQQQLAFLELAQLIGALEGSAMQR